MATNEQAAQILDEARAVKKGHFVYKAEDHGVYYVDKDAVNNPLALCRLGKMIAQAWIDEDVEVVVAPVAGAVSLGQWVAYHLCRLSETVVPFVYAEKELVPVEDTTGKERKLFEETGNFKLRSSFQAVVRGKRVLVIEDILNSGGSAKATCEAVLQAEGNVRGVDSLCNRGGVTAGDLDVPILYSLIEVTFEKWPEDECPLCKDGVPVNTDVGKGAQFLAKTGRST